MSRKKGDPINDIIIPFLVLYGIIASIVLIINSIIENLLIVQIVTLGLVGVAGVALAVTSILKRKSAAKAEKARLVAIVNSVEPKPVLSVIPTSSVFASEEERQVNQSFREFLKRNNVFVAAKTRFDYLSEKAEALKTLGRAEEARQFDDEIEAAKTALEQAKEKNDLTFASGFFDLAARSTVLKNSFSAFAASLPNTRFPLVEDFFRDPQIRIVGVNNDSVLLFTPGYVMHYAKSSNVIRLFGYENVGVSSSVSTEILKGDLRQSDEIEHIGYLHETKDGRRDLRYGYENNPSFTFVYRGSCEIRCGGASLELKFGNKSLTENFERALKAHIVLTGVKFKAAVSALMAHDQKPIGFGILGAF